MKCEIYLGDQLIYPAKSKAIYIAKWIKPGNWLTNTHMDLEDSDGNVLETYYMHNGEGYVYIDIPGTECRMYGETRLVDGGNNWHLWGGFIVPSGSSLTVSDSADFSNPTTITGNTQYMSWDWKDSPRTVTKYIFV